MCLLCNTTPDQETMDAFGERLLGMLNGGVTALMISLGHRSGLFDAMADGAPRSSDGLAQETGLNERYVREWLGGMVAARIVLRDRDTNTYALPLEHAHSLTRASATGNFAVFAQYIGVLGSVEDEVLECFKKGGGVPYTSYGRFHEVMAEDSGQSIVPAIVEKVVPLIDGMHERLMGGIDVLDVGCGKGRALMRLAQEYPNSRFSGYDFSEQALGEAKEEAAQKGLKNITFSATDLTHWTEPGAFDLIFAFDAIHDQARPDLVLRAVRGALRPEGVFLMQDIDASSEPLDNIDHPLGGMLYGISCMHCMTVSLAQGGMGLGTAWGVDTAQRMLAESGFHDVAIHRFDHDIQNAYFVCMT